MGASPSYDLTHGTGAPTGAVSTHLSMGSTLDPEPLADHVSIREVPDAQAPEPSMYGAITGRIGVGRYVLQVGETSGAVLREAATPERPHIRPRPTPILLRPRSLRGLLDRRAELAAAVSALDAGLPVEVSGEPGIGKTAVLRQLAHHSPAASFVDGLVYVSARNQPSADLLQLLFDAFYESDTICKPTDAEISWGLHDKRALILLDDVTLTEHELERVLDIAPRSAFAVVTRERRLLREVRSVPLTGLPAEDALALLEREIERPLEETERSAAADLCAAVGGHPLRILQAAALIRERGLFRDGWARDVTPEGLVAELLASLDDKHRPALSVLAALPGVPLQAQHISGLAEVPDIESSLTMLVRRGLVVSGESRYRVAAGVSDRLRRTEDLKPGVNRAITYFTAWAERHRRDLEKLLEASEALLRVQECAADARRWGEVLRLGRLLEGALALGARWGAWALTLERCLAAAKSLGDRSVEAWALHEIGTRAACLGESGRARASLGQAVKLREALQDDAGAAISRQNLAFVLAPVTDIAYARSIAPRDDLGDFDSFTLRGSVQPVSRVKTTNILTLSLTGLLAAVAGWFGYMAIAGGVVSLQQTAPRGGGAPVTITPAPSRTAPVGTRDPPRALRH